MEKMHDFKYQLQYVQSKLSDVVTEDELSKITSSTYGDLEDTLSGIYNFRETKNGKYETVCEILNVHYDKLLTKLSEEETRALNIFLEEDETD